MTRRVSGNVVWRGATRCFLGIMVILSGSRASSALAAQSGPPDMTGERIVGPVGARIDSILRRAEALGFGGQVLVEQGGEILLHRAYGYRDWLRQSRYTVATPTGVASVSKMLAAALVLRLVDMDRVRLEETLGSLLLAVPPHQANLTVHQLLTHTSGLPGGYHDPGVDTSLAEAAAEILAVRRDTTRIGKWRYSSEGYTLLAAIVERLTGDRWHDVLRREILAPAGMARTFSVAGDPLPDAAARSYVDWRESTRLDRRTSLAGAGDLYSTPGDLLRWAHVIRSKAILTDRSWRLLGSVHASVAPGYGFGYGAFLRSRGATPAAIEHGGDDLSGPAAFLAVFRDPDVTLIITSNARDHQGRWWRRALGDVLERTLFADSVPPMPGSLSMIDTRQRRALTGTYTVGDSRVDLIDTGAGLVLVARGQEAIGLVSGDTGSDLVRANRLVRSVADSLLRGRYEEAFTSIVDAASRSALTQWWAGIERAWGALHRAEVTGSVHAGSQVATQLVLHHERGTHMVRLVTDSVGALVRLDPDRVSRWALARPVAREVDGTFRAEDPFSGEFVRFRMVDDRLVFERRGVAHRSAAANAGVPGWVPD